MQRGLVGEQARHLRIEFVDGERGVETERVARAFRAEAETFPRFALDVLLAAEQDRRRGRRASALASSTSSRFGFGEAGQVIEVAVVPVRIIGVAVAHALRGAVGTMATPPPAARSAASTRSRRAAVDVDGE